MAEINVKSDLQVYLSCTYREPNADNCDKVYKNVRISKIYYLM